LWIVKSNNTRTAGYSDHWSTSIRRVNQGVYLRETVLLSRMSLDDLRKLILRSITGGECVFDNLVLQFEESLSNDVAHTLADLSLLSTTRKGRLFERLCIQYLKHISKFDEVYPISELPDDLRRLLRLPVQDTGIDLITLRKSGNTIKEVWAVQCKFRKHSARSTVNTANGRIRTNTLSWQELATFYALCDRTGPYTKRLVMTTADSVTRKVGRQPNDASICRGTWRGLTPSQWYTIAECEERTTNEGGVMNGSSSREGPSPEELRRLRLARFS